MRYLLVILLFIGYQSTAQKAFLSTAKDSVTLGQPFAVQLMLENINPNEILSIEWENLENFTCPIKDTIPISMDVELVEYGLFKKGDQLQWQEGEFKFEKDKNSGFWSNTFSLIAWEHYTCPLKGPTITLKNGNRINSFPLFKIPLKSPFNNHLKDLILGENIRLVVDSSWEEEAPIEDIFRYKRTWYDYMMWLFLLAVISFLGYVIYRFFTDKKMEEIQYETTQIEPVIPAHIVALEELEKIKKERIWENGEDKRYVSQLTHAIRTYIEGRYDIYALEQTSQEIIHSLKSTQSQEQLDSLQNTLNVSDLIKFAKASATDETYERFVNEAIDWVHSTKPTNSEEI